MKNARQELQFALTEDQWERLETTLFPRDGSSGEHGAIGVVMPSAGCKRRTLLLCEIVPQEPGDVTWEPEGEGLVFSTRYKSAARQAANEVDGGLIFLHTHPMSMGKTAPRPSPLDLESDREDLFHIGQTLAEGAPLTAGIVGGNRLFSIREYTFQFPTTPEEASQPEYGVEGAQMSYATAVRLVGEGLTKVRTNTEARGPAGASGAANASRQDSSVRIWGCEGQRILSGLRVGITGLGGVGGILAEHVARLGVGELVLIDYDCIKHDNLNRAQGARPSDAEQQTLKVEVAARVARNAATAPNFEVHSIEGSVVEENMRSYLVDCDIILNAADTDWARQVLEHLAFAYLIPVVDGGTLLRPGTNGKLLSGKSYATATGPGHLGFEAQGIYSKEGVSRDMESPAQRGERAYVQDDEGEGVRAPSVISNNCLVAGLMQLRLQAIALGTAPLARVGMQNYDAVQGTLSWVEEGEDATTSRSALIGKGDSHRIPFGIDPDYEAARAQRSSASDKRETKSEAAERGLLKNLWSKLRRLLFDE